jgi:hypothetical protein
MTDVLFSFGDEFAYSNNLANWSLINSGEQIEIMGNPEKFSVVRANVINYNKGFTVESNSIIKFDNIIKDLVLDGDTIDCYFITYYTALVNEITEAGSGYKVNEYVNINKNTYFDSSNDRNERAILQVKSVDSNGGITELHLINNGKFTQNFEQAELDGGSGKGAKVSLILGKHDKKSLKFFSVLNVKRDQGFTFVELNEKIKDSFLTGEIYIKRYRITLNKPTDKEYSSHPFILKVEKTPFLNLPLAKDNNIEQIYNQAILTIDSKIKELSTGVK